MNQFENTNLTIQKMRLLLLLQNLKIRRNGVDRVQQVDLKTEFFYRVDFPRRGGRTGPMKQAPHLSVDDRSESVSRT